MTIDLKAIRAAAEAAAPGPWYVCIGYHQTLGEVRNISTSVGAEVDVICVTGATTGSNKDAVHIATANPATILELLDRLEAAEKDAARYRWVKSEVKRIPPAWDIHGWDQCIDAAMQDDAAVDALMNSMKDEQT